jgi:hypothetical protein
MVAAVLVVALGCQPSPSPTPKPQQPTSPGDPRKVHASSAPHAAADSAGQTTDAALTMTGTPEERARRRERPSRD